MSRTYVAPSCYWLEHVEIWDCRAETSWLKTELRAGESRENCEPQLISELLARRKRLSTPSLFHSSSSNQISFELRRDIHGRVFLDGRRGSATFLPSDDAPPVQLVQVVRFCRTHPQPLREFHRAILGAAVGEHPLFMFRAAEEMPETSSPPSFGSLGSEIELFEELRRKASGCPDSPPDVCFRAFRFLHPGLRDLFLIPEHGRPLAGEDQRPLAFRTEFRVPGRSQLSHLDISIHCESLSRLVAHFGSLSVDLPFDQIFEPIVTSLSTYVK